MTFYLSGYLEGITRGRQLANADMARLWRPAFESVQAAARTPTHDAHRAAIQARQIASCERQKQEAQPWPEEDDP